MSIGETRQIKYINKSFDTVVSEFNNYAKQYFPDFFASFSETYTLERLIAEFVAYQADILNFQINDTYRQLLRQYATDAEAIYRNAKSLGYKIQDATVAVGKVRVSQLVPSILVSGSYIPDISYCGILREGTVFTTNNGDLLYTSIEDCDMSEFDSSLTIITKFQGGNPSQFRIFKDVKVRSGKTKLKQVEITNAESFKRVYVDNNVAFIISVVDSEGNTWKEVDYLAQDYIFERIKNDGSIKEYQDYIEQTPYILKIRKVPRRFIVDRLSDKSVYLMFGAGRDVINNELLSFSADEILTNNQLANLSLSNTIIADGFTKSDSYGLTPYNTTLTIRYVVTEGSDENLKPYNITSIASGTPIFNNNVPDEIKNSFVVTNPEPIVGADILTDLSKIKNESVSAFVSQNRCVTTEDYMFRCKLMPSYFGSINKTYVERNPLNNSTLDIYVLSKDVNGYSTQANMLTKTNLMNYINEYRMIGTKLNIKDAYIINFSISFEYSIRKGYDKNLVFIETSRKIEEYFNPNKWEINQPILVEDLKLKMYEVEGLVSVNNLNFECINTDGYSKAYYNMNIISDNPHFDKSKGILYPPSYPSIFELKNPKLNIKGKYV